MKNIDSKIQNQESKMVKNGIVKISANGKWYYYNLKDCKFNLIKRSRKNQMKTHYKNKLINIKELTIEQAIEINDSREGK